MKLSDIITEQDDTKKGDVEKEELQKCRGCGRDDDGTIGFIKGLCKDCAEDTYADRD